MADETKERREGAAIETPEAVEGMPRNPAGTPNDGLQTAEDVARPREPSLGNEEWKTPAGFTTTGPSGSAGGRATWGVASSDATEARTEDQEDA